MNAEGKQLGLWGDKPVGVVEVKRTKRQVFEDYDAFVAKFDKNAPKTTDDCFTPQSVYEVVLAWLRERVDLSNRPIIRPFYPGGDYENEEYPENCVVVDNPPFSILAKIIRFYRAVGIDYFLFAPGLTLFGVSPEGDCSIVSDSQITYANGAVVCTGFHTSLFPGVKVMIAGSLGRLIAREQQQQQKKKKKTRVYSKNVITSALLNKYAKGGDVVLYDKEVTTAKRLDCGQALFGGGI